ncbi:MAG: hypothetical protein QXG86_03275 [Candidatus Woesearchaeota archaeon]
MKKILPYKQQDPGGVYNYIVVSDIFGIDDYFISNYFPIIYAEKNNLKNIFLAKNRFQKKDSDFTPFLLLNFYDMLGIKEELKNKVNILFIEPQRVKNYNIALVVNPPLNSVKVTEENFFEPPHYAANYIPLTAKSRAGEIYIIDLERLIKSYKDKFIRENSLYQQFYPEL